MDEVEKLEMEDTITPQKYLEKINSFLKQSTPENSIIFEFDIDANDCHTKAIKYEIDGSKEELEEENFSDAKLVIKELLEPFLKKFTVENKIVINQISPYKEEKVSLKIISEHNDMCNIHGLQEEEATRISEAIGQSTIHTTNGISQEKIDQKGFGNAMAFVFSILLLGAIILGMLVPSFLK